MLRCLLLALPLLVAAQTERFDEAEAVDVAKEVLADELDVDRSRLETYRVLAAQWRDSSLGCPRPGMVYLPTLTRGYRVFLRRTDEPSQLYEVHVGPGEAVVCEAADPDMGRTLPKSEGEAVARELRTAPRLARMAREDLAARLDVDPAEIDVSVIPRVWTDAGLGCPEEDRTYEAARVEGFLILLVVDEATYAYHADRESVFLCEEPAEDER